MSGYLPLSFIQDKVRDLENALFFSLSDAVLKIPACVVKVLETDALGQLWFMIPRPSQFIHAFDKNFPAKLEFSRKGREYFLKVNGNACLVNDPEEINTVDCINDEIKTLARANKAILVKVKMLHADYIETTPAKTASKSLISQVKHKIYNWFQISHADGNIANQRIPGQIKYSAISSFTN